MKTPIRLYYIEKGRHHEKHLVLLHGFMGNAASFNDLIERLSRHVHVVALDLPGHGRSNFNDMPQLYHITSFAQLGDVVLDTLTSLDIKKFYLYGYSMGGRVAQQVSLNAPDRIQHLILESASFGIQDEIERKARYEKDQKLLSNVQSTEDLQYFLKVWHDLPLFCTLKHTPILQDLIQQKLQNPIHELKRALSLISTGNHPFFAQVFATGNIPITYLFGENDIKYKAIAANAKKQIAHMHLNPVKNASHNIHAQHPDYVINIIKAIIF